MTTLSITVPFHDDETIASYASRLAAANYASGVREFCGHMGLNHQKLIDGEPEEVARLMALADYELRSSDKRVVKRNGLFHEINGEVLARSSFLRSRLRHCPHCLAEDYENGSGVVTSRPYGRLAWCVTFIRTCPRHNVLLQLTERSSLEGGHDIAAMIAAWQRDPNVHPPAARCIQTDFESYVTERLWGRWDRRSWLDSLPLYVAGKMCEMVGATIRLGKRFVFDDLSEMDWVDSAQVGFEVLCKGEDAFRSFLEGLHSDFWDGEGDTGGRHLYGRLYERLAYESDDPAFDCVRAIMREVALSSIPFGPGDDMFGPVIERRFHTIQSASKEFNLHPLTLRKLLLKVGVIGTSAKDLTPDRILVPKDVVADVVAKYTSGMNWSKAWLYLNSGRTLWNTLTHGGYIPRAFADGHETGLGPIYAKSDLDAFLARMKTMVNQEFVACAKLTSFSKTARRANCRFAEILDLLLDGKLTVVAIDPRDRGIEAFRFDAREIARLTSLTDHGALSLREAQKLLAITDRTLTGLIGLGFIEADVAINPRNRCPQKVVRPEVINCFKSEFTSLYHYARERGINIGVAKRQLEAAGIHPAIEKAAVGTTFYKTHELTR